MKHIYEFYRHMSCVGLSKFSNTTSNFWSSKQCFSLFVSCDLTSIPRAWSVYIPLWVKPVFWWA